MFQICQSLLVSLVLTCWLVGQLGRRQLDRLVLDRLVLDRLGLDRLGLGRLGLDRLGLDRLGLDRLGLRRFPLGQLQLGSKAAQNFCSSWVTFAQNMFCRRYLRRNQRRCYAGVAVKAGVAVGPGAASGWIVSKWQRFGGGLPRKWVASLTGCLA